MSVEDPRIGASYGPYRLERRLGEGGMGMVYRAVHARTGRRYAVKLLHPATPGSEAAAQSEVRFRREARALSELRHANVVAIHDFDVTDRGEPFLVMDLLEGEPLASRIDRGRGLGWDAATKIFHQLASALDALHDVGVVHRDVKPSNVLLAREPGGEERAVLIDFGLAKDLAPEASVLTGPDTALGTPSYMAPEQARGQPIDRRTDVYALGIVLYEMIAGRPPFVGPTPTAVLAQTLVDPPPPLSAMTRARLPSGIDATIERALAKDPTARYPDARTLSDAIRALTGDPHPSPSLPRTRAMPIASPSRRRPPWLALAILGIPALAAAAAGIAWWQSRPPPEASPSRSSSPPLARLGPDLDGDAPALAAASASLALDASPSATQAGAAAGLDRSPIATQTTARASLVPDRSPIATQATAGASLVPDRSPIAIPPTALVDPPSRARRRPPSPTPSAAPPAARAAPRAATAPGADTPVSHADPLSEARAAAARRDWRGCVSSLTSQVSLERDELSVLMICADRIRDRSALERGCREIARLLLFEHPWHQRCQAEILGDRQLPRSAAPALRGDDLAEHQADELRQRGDFAGCVRALESVTHSYPGMMMRLDCAELSGDPALLRSACRRYIDARIPARTRFNPLCESALAQ